MPSPTRVISAVSPLKRDAGGLFEFAGAAFSLFGAAGVAQAVSDRRFTRTERAVGAALSSAYLFAGTLGALKPGWLARQTVEHPIAVGAVGAAPTVLAPLLGRRFSAFHALCAAGAPLATGIVRRTDPRLVGGALAIAWAVPQATRLYRAHDADEDPKFVLVFSIVPLAIYATSALGPLFVQSSRDLGLLDGHLARVNEERERLRASRAPRLATLRQLSAAFDSVEGPVSQLEGPAGDDVRKTLARVRGRLSEAIAIAGTIEDRVDGAERARGTVQTQVDVARSAARVDGAKVADPTVRIDVDAVLSPSARRVVALAINGSVSNALRHGTAVTTVATVVEQDGEHVVVRITNDGDPVSSSDPGAGLQNLAAEARVHGGELTSLPDDAGGWTVQLRLPIQVDAVPVSFETTSLRTQARFDSPLADAVRAMSLIVSFVAFAGHELEASTRTRSRVLTGLTLGIYHAVDLSGGLGMRRRLQHPTRVRRTGSALLWGTAAVSAISSHHEHSLWSGWALAAVTRHAVFASKRETAWLAAAHAAAICVSHRGGPQSFAMCLLHQVILPITVPAGLARYVNKALARFDEGEVALNAGLADVEREHDLISRLLNNHGLREPFGQLIQWANLLEPSIAPALQHAYDDMDRVSEDLPLPLEPTAFVDDLNQKLAEHVAPVEVEVVGGERELNGMGRDVLSSMAFRRRAFDALAVAGDAMNETFPLDRLGKPTVERVRVTFNWGTKTLFVTMRPAATTGRVMTTAHERLESVLVRGGGTVNAAPDREELILELPFVETRWQAAEAR